MLTTFLGDAVEYHGKHQTNGVSEVQILCSPVAESLVWQIKYDYHDSLFLQIQHCEVHLTGVKFVGQLHSGSGNGLLSNA